MAPRRAALLYNPAAGRRRHARVLDDLRAVLAAAGWAAEPIPTPQPGAATGMARELAAGGAVEAVLAFGGDGTVREVAAGLIGTGVALGLLPGGTVNLLARALGLPADPLAAAAALAGLAPRPLDVGLAGATPFLMMVSAGLDGAALAGLASGFGRFKARFGRSAIAAQALREWWRYTYPELTVTADGRALSATFVVIANIPLYGGPFRLVPEARPDDGRLDLLVFRGRRAATARFAWDLLRGAHLRRPDVTALPVTEVLLAGPPGALAQVDGDPCPEPLPLRVRLAPEKLLVLAP